MLNNHHKRVLVSFLGLIFLSGTTLLSAKPKAKNTEENKAPAVYKKYIHPREYVFDLSDAKNKVSLKVDEKTGKAYCNVDFTDLVKEQMPRKGDKVTFVYEGSSSKDVEAITATVYDLSKGENIGNKAPEIFTTAVAKKETFKKSFSLLLKSDAEKSLSLRLTASLPESKKKVDKVDLSFKRVQESTNTKKEAEEEKEAIKNGLKIVRVKSNFTVVEKKAEVKEEPSVEEQTSEESEPEAEIEPEAEVPETNVTVEVTTAETEEETAVTVDEIAEETVEVSESEEKTTETEDVKEEVAQAISEPVEEKIEEEILDVPELEPVQEKIVIKIEPQVIPEPAKPVVTETAKVSESTYEPIIVKNKVSRYEKEYLQDYAVMDELETTEPEAEEQEVVIPNPNEKDNKGRTKLMVAAKTGNKELIRQLLYSGADINLTDKEGWTALMYAARYQSDITCFDMLLESGATVKTNNKYGLSALMFAACYNSNPQILERLLSSYSPSDREVMKSFILLLTESPNTDKVQLAKTKVFVNYSIPVNTFYNGKTPLMYAAEYCNSTKIIRELLENNAKTAIRSSEGKTAFDYAESNSKLEHDNVYWTLNKK